MKSRKDKLHIALDFFKRYAITIWLVAACAALVTIISYAAYTYQNYSKKVVTINGGGGLQFSSDTLRAETTSSSEEPLSVEYSGAAKYVYSTAGEEKMTTTFTVCNYPQNSPSSCYSGSIAYIMYAKIVDNDGKELTAENLAEIIKKADEENSKEENSEDNETEDKDSGEDGEDAEEKGDEEDNSVVDTSNLITISYVDSNGDIKTYDLMNSENYKVLDNQLLRNANNKSVKHTYTLSVDSRLTNEVSVELEVIPTTLSQTENHKLWRKFVFATKPEQSMAWTGMFVDDKIENEKYSAYNYEISGNESATMILSWDTTYITLGQQWIKYFEKTPTDVDENGWQSITIEVGKPDTNDEIISSYTLQFYRVSTNTAQDYPSEDWVTFVKDTSQTTETTDKENNTDEDNKDEAGN